MYKWGDAKQGKQNAMDAHRLLPHHLGNADGPVDWVERAANFVIHHIPREHHGIRHEPRGTFSQIEERMALDSAIKFSEIGKEIARDVAALCEMLEKEGKIVPWYLLKVPAEPLTPSLIEHAFLVASTAGQPPEDPDEYEEHMTQINRAKAVIAQVPDAANRAEAAGRSDLAIAYRELLQNVRS
jgi:hypothetical protein